MLSVHIHIDGKALNSDSYTILHVQALPNCRTYSEKWIMNNPLAFEKTSNIVYSLLTDFKDVKIVYILISENKSSTISCVNGHRYLISHFAKLVSRIDTTLNI